MNPRPLKLSSILYTRNLCKRPHPGPKEHNHDIVHLVFIRPHGFVSTWGFVRPTGKRPHNFVSTRGFVKPTSDHTTLFLPRASLGPQVKILMTMRHKDAMVAKRTECQDTNITKTFGIWLGNHRVLTNVTTHG
jgi:hypothetical protein